MLYAAQYIRPLNEIIILGDFADFYNINRYGRSSTIKESLHEEIESVRFRLKQIQELFPTAKRVFLEGNHEYRLKRYIDDNCSHLYNYIDIGKLLKLEEAGFTLIPYTPDQSYAVLGTSMLARHEPIGGGANSANSTVSKASSSVVFGHTHKIQEHNSVSLSGESFKGWSLGWLGDNESEVFSYVKGHHQWQLGFGVLTVTDNEWFTQTVEIKKSADGRYVCVLEGVKYATQV
jgi:hypothetical protein